ncbi:hypothetical protein SpCBS45565_g08025 [Spizellomyces sp. 'palustris']|nr:hypothetical protein SpCBS45565_g08025 [Spizellomyces sp. 'palustris']
MIALHCILFYILVAPALAITSPQYDLPPLPYPHDALEPHLDAETMLIHHDRHHRAYTNNLNAALAKIDSEGALKDEGEMTVEALLNRLALEEAGDVERARWWGHESIRRDIRNNGGGYVNHKIYFANLAPNPISEHRQPSPGSSFSVAINTQYDTVANLTQLFTNAALSVFGSGWVFLCYVPDTNEVDIIVTKDQDVPQFAPGYEGRNMTVVLALDIWEHAYYLKYRNHRKDYINAWWQVVNWTDVERRFDDGVGVKSIPWGRDEL